MSFYTELGLLIKNRRDQKGLTQSDLCFRLGLSRQSLYGYERGTIVIKMQNFLKIYHALELEPDDISGLFERERKRNVRSRRLLHKPIDW